ncbi:hypothetical protein COI53_27545 [Bacillus thuringiensis]|uniref:hypothetical protein n=1 Tax=Bacillus thuringiensis TaxID=1428 RepID=UPI000BF40148|nr:hypothetical protein [Bacillus thuringiensis]PFI26435.1 hypothetical protein COI53_27545 [Bacillus thuringiensis]PGQ51226.1 hypothetical protein COA16_30070 [Bacillus thuringiensis]
MDWLHILIGGVSSALVGFKLINESRNSYWIRKKTKLEIKKLEREEREAELKRRREQNKRSVR